MAKISCFTIIRDTLSQGYPFVESIISAMPICDEFIIVDGYSKDGTYEILKKLKKKHPKIRLYQEEWEGSKENILATMTNKAKERCRGSWLFYIQANEIVHEESIGRIKDLPDTQRTGLEIFHLPFNHIMGKDLVFQEEFRSRLVKNKQDIGAINDATHLTYYKYIRYKHMQSALLTPWAAKDMMDKVISFWGEDGINRVWIHTNLPKPIFRYFGIFKNNYLKKMEQHSRILPYNSVQSDRMIDLIRSSTEASFPKKWHNSMVKFNLGSYLQKPQILELSDHPKIMKGLIKSKLSEYKVREELL